MRDINALPNSRGDDPRTLEKLADGVNNTFDDEHMWLAPYDPQCVLSLSSSSLLSSLSSVVVLVVACSHCTWFIFPHT
jgi:hypothetical protein